MAYGVWEGMQPGRHGSAAFAAGAWGGRLPPDWEIADCETYAILRYLQRVVERLAHRLVGALQQGRHPQRGAAVPRRDGERVLEAELVAVLGRRGAAVPRGGREASQ